MPYGSPGELPESQTRGMSAKEKKILHEAFNRAIYEEGVGESDAWARAHGAVNRYAEQHGRSKPKNRRKS